MSNDGIFNIFEINMRDVASWRRIFMMLFCTIHILTVLYSCYSGLLLSHKMKQLKMVWKHVPCNMNMNMEKCISIRYNVRCYAVAHNVSMTIYFYIFTMFWILNPMLQCNNILLLNRISILSQSDFKRNNENYRAYRRFPVATSTLEYDSRELCRIFSWDDSQDQVHRMMLLPLFVLDIVELVLIDVDTFSPLPQFHPFEWEHHQYYLVRWKRHFSVIIEFIR